jgi:hypothetical protein
LVENDTLTFYEVISSSYASLWKETIKIELDSILQNKTWNLVDLPPGAKLISCKWIFQKKKKKITLMAQLINIKLAE